MRQLAIVAVGAMLMATSTPPIRSEDAATAQTTMRIVQGQRYGTGDGRSMLSRAAAVAESADGALYVLDPGLNKVVVFNRDGTLRRLVAIGMGRGPGELEAPRSIALSDEGELIVLDGRAGRAVVLDTIGQLKRTLTLGVPALLSVSAIGNRLYTTRLVMRPTDAAVLIYDLQGTRIGESFVPSLEERDFARAGNGHRIAQLQDGNLVVAALNPGSWSLLANSGRRFGRALVADNRVIKLARSSAVSALALTSGFAAMADGRVLVFYVTHDPTYFQRRDAASAHNRVAVFRADGSLVGTLALADSVGTFVASSRDGRELYFQVTEPFPQLVRCRVE